MELVKLKGAVYDRVTVRATWDVNIPASSRAVLPIVVEGGGVLKIEGREIVQYSTAFLKRGHCKPLRRTDG